MNISGVNGSTSPMAGSGAGQAEDIQSRNIRKQIEEAQKKLQEVSANGELSAEDKMKKRQEIQKQISDLRMQLREHQMELRRKQREEKQAAEHNVGTEAKAGEQSAGLSAAGMQAVISSEASMKQAKVQNGAAAKMEGRAGVLEAEIKQDGRSGGDTSAKEAELAGVKERAKGAAASGMKTLGEANRKIQDGTGNGQKAEGKEADTKAEKEKETNKTKQTDKDGADDDKNQKEPGKYVDVRL